MDIAGLADGDIVMAWQDGSTNSNTNVAAQLAHGNGAQAGRAFFPALSNGPNDRLVGVNVVGLGNGNFVVTWVDQVVQGVTLFSTVCAQLYQTNLTKIGGVITVIPTLQGSLQYTGASALANGGFVCAAGGGGPVYAQAIQADGNKIGGLVTTDVGAAGFTQVAGLTNGGWVVFVGNPGVFEVFDDNDNRIARPTGLSGGLNGRCRRAAERGVLSSSTTIQTMGGDGRGADLQSRRYKVQGAIDVNNGVEQFVLTSGHPPCQHDAGRPVCRRLVARRERHGSARLQSEWDPRHGCVRDPGKRRLW